MAVLPEKIIDVLNIFLNILREGLTNPLIEGFAIVLLVFAIISLIFAITGFRR